MFRRFRRRKQLRDRGWLPQLSDGHAEYLGIDKDRLQEGESLRPVVASDRNHRRHLWGISDDEDHPTSHLVWLLHKMG